jgi:hypothetical protein
MNGPVSITWLKQIFYNVIQRDLISNNEFDRLVSSLRERYETLRD